jgi:hypothetical protein
VRVGGWVRATDALSPSCLIIYSFLASLALKQRASNVNVLQTQNAQIIFEIGDLSRSNITWLFNGNLIQPSAKYKMETKLQIILNVNKTDSIDSGTYTAVIENGIEKLVVPVKMTVRGNMESVSLRVKVNILRWNKILLLKMNILLNTISDPHFIVIDIYF